MFYPQPRRLEQLNCKYKLFLRSIATAKGNNNVSQLFYPQRLENICDNSEQSAPHREYARGNSKCVQFRFSQRHRSMPHSNWRARAFGCEEYLSPGSPRGNHS